MEHISSKDNAKIKRFSKLVSDKKYRKETNLFVLEGQKLLKEAKKWNIKIDTLVLSENIKDLEQYNEIDTNIIVVPEHIMEKISDTKTPQGVIFSCEMLDYTDIDYNKLKKVIILDNIQDPGNLGTIIRTGAGFKIDAIIMLNNCVDCYSPKVVRATMNGIFQIPIISMDLEECFSKIKLPIYATYLSEESQNIIDCDFSECAVIIGNESNGISSEVLKYADKKIIIPIKNIESLNASIATSIIMWEMSK